MAEKALTPKQEKFAQLVGSGQSLSDAYRGAYEAGKMKPEVIWVKASELASKGNVSVRIKEIQSAGADRAELEASEIIREIRRVSLSDIAGIMHPDGRVKMPHELDAATRAAVASFEINQYGEIKYKFWDKNSALEKAAKIRGLFEADNAQKPAQVVTMVRLVPLDGDGKKGGDGNG